ncbi:MAG: GMC family oxidoreductase N-terminal domain-containing protein, partial [Chlamydiota bacterium]
LSLPEGGGSSVNAGAWCRGTNQLFSQWETIAGPEWSVNRILKIYKQLEDYSGKTNNKKARGENGPLGVIQNRKTPIAEVFTQAVIDATGFPFVLDYNDPNTPIGASPQIQLTRRGDQGFYRISSTTAFLNEHVVNSHGKGTHGRKLQIHLDSTALRVIWNGNTAIGVSYLKNGKVKNVYAKKGVIVCAGLGSSPFLMHSGVGPAGVLTSLGIPVIYDNPNVGQGLADQP